MRSHRLALPLLLAALAPAQVMLLDPAGGQLVRADAKWQLLANDLTFSEGPVWLAASKQLLFSDIPKGKLRQWTADKGVQDHLATEQGNGNTLDLQGRLISCQHGARNVVRREPDGKVTVLADRFDDKPFNSPNDVVVRNDGTIWFTDPTYGLAKRKQEQKGCHVYRLDPATGAVTVVQTDFDQPNGICFAPDHQRVYIADSGKRQRIGAFPVGEDGVLGAPLFWIDGGADGIRCDQHGNLWAAAGPSGIRAFSPAGKPLLEIECDQIPTNLTFGGDDGKTLFVTARTLLLSMPVLVAAAPMPEPAPAPKKPPGEASGRKDGGG